MKFQCPCSWIKDFSEERNIQKHMNECQQFNDKSPLARITGGMKNLSNQQILTLRNDLKVQIDRIENEIKQRGVQINSEEKIQKQQMQKIQQRSMNSSLEDEFQFHQNQKLPCENCRKLFSPDFETECIWYLNQCLHMVCKKCLKIIVERDYLINKGKILCCEIGCGEILTSYDMEMGIGRSRLEELEEKLSLMNQNIISCVNCSSKYGFEGGNIGEIVKDLHGKQLQGQPLDHYVNNRFICRNEKCKIEQCKSCGATPYHIGYNCENFKKQQKAVKCRLCEQQLEQIDQKLPLALQEICNQEDCQKRLPFICTKKLNCGHFCQGMKNESDCLPCLDKECVKNNPQINCDKDDYCNICFTEPLKGSACIQSQCGHIFHYECVIKKLQTRWNGPRIVTNYTLCPLCKKEFRFSNDQKELEKLLIQADNLKSQVANQALDRLEVEGRQNDKELNDPKHQFYHDPIGYSLAIFCYYECHKCKRPYFGGLKSCQNNIEDDRRVFNKEDLICTDCCPITFENKCKQHGNQYIEFKCRFCCSPAVWFCFGNTHFCDPCHNQAGRNEIKICKGPETCPLRVYHEPNGKECSLGCAVCRQKRMDKKI